MSNEIETNLLVRELLKTFELDSHRLCLILKVRGSENNCTYLSSDKDNYMYVKREFYIDNHLYLVLFRITIRHSKHWIKVWFILSL